MMKYGSLRDYFSRESRIHVKLSFSELEKIIGFPLPRSAYVHRAWWANDETHVHALAWIGENWVVEQASLGSWVSFKKNSRHHHADAKNPPKTSFPNSAMRLGENDSDKKQKWFWEGNIQQKIASYMVNNENYKILKMANCAAKSRGPDILALRKAIQIHVSVKGYPTETYAEDSLGGKKGEKKRTRPQVQARHWFAEALFEILLAKCENNNLQIALGFPDFPVYISFLKRIKWLRERLGIRYYLVTEEGEVRVS